MATKQLGWRIDKSIYDIFVRTCEERLSDPAKVISYLLKGWILKGGTYQKTKLIDIEDRTQAGERHITIVKPRHPVVDPGAGPKQSSPQSPKHSGGRK